MYPPCHFTLLSSLLLLISAGADSGPRPPSSSSSSTSIRSTSTAIKMPSVQEQTPSTLYDKIYADHLIDGHTIYIDRFASPKASCSDLLLIALDISSTRSPHPKLSRACGILAVPFAVPTALLPQ